MVHGKIARFANFGAFVELDDNLEGLCHISELSEERVEKPEDVVQLGQEMEFKILQDRFRKQEDRTSARAVGKETNQSSTPRSIHRKRVAAWHRWGS